ncbi:MAG: flagellar biosynthesis protein FlhB [Aliidongia sp.]|nr:flagellar biosynthesis protein FlhB [Aliidongia sp.]
MAEDQDSRTEDPTGRRRTEARGQGQVGVSRDVSTALSLIAAAVVFLLVLPWSVRPLVRLMRGFIEQPQAIPISTLAEVRILIARVVETVGIAMAMPVAVLAITGIATTIAQTEGLLWATGKLKLHFDFLNPITGFKRVFGWKSLVEFIKGVAKVAIVGTSAYLIIKPEVIRVTLMIGMPPDLMLATLIDDIRHLLTAVILTILAIAFLDYFYQKWVSLRSLKMTKQEVKDEVKNTDGDPHVKNRQRQIRMTRAKKRMLQAVPTASVVITNPTHYAIALYYEMGMMGAPKVVAKGVDHMAQKIRELAIEHDVPIVENPPVARALYAAVDIDEEITPEHFKAVAEIIGYVLKMRRWKMAG